MGTIADAYVALDAAVRAGVPFAQKTDPDEGSSGISAGVLFDDEDFWAHNAEPEFCEALVSGPLSAHTRMAIHIPMRTAFDALMKALGETAPALAGPYIRLSVDGWENREKGPKGKTRGNGTINVYVCIFGHALSRLALHEDPIARGKAFEEFAEDVKPLGPATTFWRMGSDETPIAAASPVDALAMMDAIGYSGKTRWSLSNWLASGAAHQASRVCAYPTPDAIAAAMARLRSA